MNRIAHDIGCLASAVPCFILAVVLARTWLDPMAVDDGAWVPLAVGLMALEFLLLHSGVFMGSMALKAETMPRRVAIFAALTIFYGINAVAFSLMTGTWAILEIFGLLMAGRLVTLVAATGDGKQALIARSAAGIVIYLPVVFLTVFVPVPELGITDDVLAEVYPDRGGGLWERAPERAIAGAVLYFGITGLSELSMLVRSPGKPGKAVETA